MITKRGADAVSAIKPLATANTLAKPKQVSAVQLPEPKPVMPTTQTQDVANNLRGIHETGYDSREGFGRPDLNNTGTNRKTAMITKIGNDLLTKEAGGLLGTALGGAKTLFNGVKTGVGSVKPVGAATAAEGAAQGAAKAPGFMDKAKAGWGGIQNSWVNELNDTQRMAVKGLGAATAAGAAGSLVF